MISRHTLDVLAEIQEALCRLLVPVDDHDCRAHHHPDLSPLSWHLGHCAFIELYWLSEVIGGDDRRTASLHNTYFPELAPPKAQRAASLPARDELLAWVRDLQAETRAVLSNVDEDTHPLLHDEYLAHFLIQHNCQHYETMQMALAQRALGFPDTSYSVTEALTAQALNTDSRTVASGEYTVGTRDTTCAYDNELPVQRVRLEGFRIGAQPVTNAEFLAFMDDAGYENKTWWSRTGWRWRLETNTSHPEYWRRDLSGQWYTITTHGARDLSASAAVVGLNHHEASAFANWASSQQSGARGTIRLPHEYEWETARRTGNLATSGHAWEWCANTFHPYPGFSAFPYQGYSIPWFDSKHYVLRGGSSYTRASIKRPGFRNFYNPDKRHIFAGLRLVFA